jgi:hypothetical protein
MSENIKETKNTGIFDTIRHTPAVIRPVVRVDMAKSRRAGPADDTVDLPIIGKITAVTLTRLDRMGMGLIILLIVSLFMGATGVWGASHIGEPVIKTYIENEKAITQSQIEKDHALVEAIRLAASNAEANQKRTQETVQMLVDFMQRKHDDDAKLQAVLTDLRDEIRARRVSN